MTSYKTIVRGLIKNYIFNYMNQHYTGWADVVRINFLTISEDRCLFVTYVLMFACKDASEFMINGEVLSSGSVVIDCVEVQ